MNTKYARMGFLGEVTQEQAKHKRVPKSFGQVLKWERKERATEKKRGRGGQVKKDHSILEKYLQSFD